MKKILFYTKTALNFLSISRDKDKETISEITPDLAKVALIETDVQSSADIVSITESQGIEGLHNFFDLINDTDSFDDTNPFSETSEVSHQEYRELIKKQTILFRQIFNPQKSLTGRTEEGGFDFEGNKGVYSWNSSKERFVQAGESEFIILNFPTEESQTLNVSLRITEFEEVLTLDGGDEFYQSTRLKADLTIDNALVIDADMAITYNDSGDPTSGNISFQLAPYTFSLVFDDTQSTSVPLIASISENGEIIAGVNTTVTFKSADKEDINEVSGSIQYGELSIRGNITNTGSDYVEPNDFINLKVYQNDAKLGDITFIEGQDDFNETEYIPYIQYNDNSTERLEDLFKNTIIELENFFYDLEELEG